MGGLTVLGAGTLPISFFRRVSKLWDFMTLLGHLFPKHGSNLTSMSYKMNFWRFFYYMYPCFRSSCCSGEAFHPAVSAAHSCMRDVKWSLWDANDFVSSVGGIRCSFARLIYTPQQFYRSHLVAPNASPSPAPLPSGLDTPSHPKGTSTTSKYTSATYNGVKFLQNTILLTKTVQISSCRNTHHQRITTNDASYQAHSDTTRH